ncbi:MAG: bifunctional folylpolyglutamate synthase/dihydrofolate synthase, partial [Clostridia bacterium]|nr:bifunctional folylpolyglutamate synthase/dihydrofolate synthase [Clostridia bacterium]
MNYQQAVEYIHSCSHAGGHAGNSRILPLCEKLGSPQKKMKFVHVAGSSGKGSTAAMTESVLRAAGHKTGLYMSPYVFDFRERLQINGALPDGQLIADALESMLPALDEMKKEGRECTEFEVLTALAFVLFSKAGCEWTVLEVGIGGRLDCTNVIDPPECAVICNIGLDHTNLLGNTIPEIAYEKCGIIKKGSRVSAYCDLVPEAR